MKTVTQARASIIDRLIDLKPESQREDRPLRSTNLKTLRASIARDIGWLLNTRTSLPGETFDDQRLTVIDYGIPDFGTYSPAGADNRRLLAKRIEKALYGFESRLRNVSVQVMPEMLDEKTLQVVIDAVMVVETVREPVSFLTIFQKEKGRWDIHVSR